MERKTNAGPSTSLRSAQDDSFVVVEEDGPVLVQDDRFVVVEEYRPVVVQDDRFVGVRLASDQWRGITSGTPFGEEGTLRTVK
jgi:hypothetical protein